MTEENKNEVLSWEALEQNTTKITLTLDLKVTEADYCSIIISSFEGGSNYWVERVELKDAEGLDVEEARPDHEPVATYAFHVLRHGGTVKFIDMEEPDDSLNYDLTYDKLKEGLVKFLKDWSDRGRKLPISDGAIDSGNIDSGDADCIVQWALFGEVVYG